MGCWVLLSALLAPWLVALVILVVLCPCCPRRLKQKTFSFSLRMIWPFRYNIRITGLSALPKDQGILFMPNHPALIDPIIMLSCLTKHFRIHPVVAEQVYLNNKRAFDMTDPLPVPDFGEGTNSYTKHVMREVLQGVVDKLEQKKSVLMYPAGRLMRSGEHFIEVGNSAAFDVLSLRKSEKPWRVCLVHVDGLWGSRFSMAYTDSQPRFFKELKKGICELFCCFLLFMPKRRIDIKFELLDEIPAFEDKLAMNQFLKSKYNASGPESLAKPGDKEHVRGKGRVPTSCCSSKVRALPELTGSAPQTDEEELDPKVVNKVLNALAKHLGKPVSQLEASQDLSFDLGMDSIQLGELLGWLDEEFNVQDVQATELSTVGSIVQIVSGRSRSGAATARPPPSGWKEANRPGISTKIEGNSVAEAFICNAKRMGKAVMAGDDLGGVLTYDRALIGAILFANFLRAHPERCEGGRIGVMMPAAGGVGVLIAAVMLAGCSPVMVNWTVGRASLEHVLQSTKIKTVITSKRFLKKLGADVDLTCLLEQPGLLLFTDDLKENKFGGFGKLNKLSALRASKKSVKSLIQRFKLNELNRSMEAVVLFTSGSESVPKGVPLTHGNVLTNVEGMMAVAEAKDSDCIFGALPPFHSFGFTVTTCGPMVSGLKAAYYPNPTEYRRIAREISRWSPTMYLGTPTFVNGALQAAKAERDNQKASPPVPAADNKKNGPAVVVPVDEDSGWMTRSLRLCVVGAEKAPDALYDFCEKVHEPRIQLLEGYGITETGPVLTANRPGKDRNGVGWTIPQTSIALLAVDPYLLKEVQVIARCGPDHQVEGAVGEQGVIVAQGPSVFGQPDGNPPKAYLGIPLSEKNPFVTVQGSWWYDTGDLGYLDENGALYLTGRLKRFVKIAGEMISLGALEAGLKSKEDPSAERQKPWADREEGPVVAVESYEADGEKPILGLISAIDINLDDANAQLREAGMPKIAKLSVIVDTRQACDPKWAEQGTLPLLGTGKSDYAQMKKILKAAVAGS